MQIFLYEACLKFHNGTGLRWRGTAKDGTDWYVHGKKNVFQLLDVAKASIFLLNACFSWPLNFPRKTSIELEDAFATLRFY